MTDICVTTYFFQAKYPVKEKKIFTIEEPKPKIKFEDFMKGTFKKAKIAKLDITTAESEDQEMSETVDKAEEKVEMISNIHPPSRVSCLGLEPLDSAPHKWLCDGR